MSGKLTLKVLVLAIAFLLAIVAAAAVAWVSIERLRTYAEHIDHEVIGQIEASDAFALHMSRANGDMQAYILGHEEDDLDQARQDLAAAGAQIQTLMGLAEHESAHSVATYESYQKLLAQREGLVNRMQVLIDKARSLADADPAGAKDELEAIAHDISAINVVTMGLLRGEVADATSLVTTGISWTQASTMSMAGLATGLMIVGLLLIQFVIVRPVSALSSAAGAVVAGDHDVQLAVTSRDEIGRLQQSFNTMITTLGRQQQSLQEQVVSAHEARSAAEQASATIAQQLEMILKQRTQIREMDIPVIPVSDITLVIPLVGTLDSERIDNLSNRALHAVVNNRARLLALDVTGTLVIDEVVARGLVHVLQSVRLLGAEVILVGVRPEVAQTIVQMGFDLRGMRSFSTLQSALKSAQLDLAPVRVG